MALLASPATVHVTTIENESPFLSYVEEAGGATGLGGRGEVAVYTAGFPSPVLVGSLAAAMRRNPGVELRHWGDADLGGLGIWWLLRSRIDRPVMLFRTTAAGLEDAARSGGTPIGDGERAGLERLVHQLRGSAVSDATDVRGAIVLAETLLRVGVRIEQERY